MKLSTCLILWYHFLLYKDPKSGVTFFQERIYVSRVILVRKYFKKIDIDDQKCIDEMKVFKNRGLDRYVVMKEAIDDLYNKEYFDHEV